MGANAQTTVPTFSASQILTAEQMNQSARTGVPVVASTATRDACFGGAGEKTLAEGQLAYLEGSGLQAYNGTNWVTAGLDLIVAQTIGSGVSSVTVSNAFSSAYENYRITISGGAGSTATRLNIVFGATTTGYYYAFQGTNYSAGTGASAFGSNVASIDYVGNVSTDSIIMNCDVFAPNLTKNTIVSGTLSQNATSGSVAVVGGYLANATAYTAFTIATATGTITGGTIRVYGYRN